MKGLKEEALALGIKAPSQRALDNYGLTADEWLALLKEQDWKCPICEKTERLWNTDHDHAPGWKKMPPEERKTYVRGVLCWYCNHRRVDSRMTAAEAFRIARYLERYEKRRGA